MMDDYDERVFLYDEMLDAVKASDTHREKGNAAVERYIQWITKSGMDTADAVVEVCNVMHDFWRYA